MPVEEKQKTPAKRPLIIVLVILAAVVIVGILFYAGGPGEVRTNDAQIDGHIHPVNARVEGTILWVNPAVENTRFVSAGTAIAHLDPNDYKPAVDRLEGDEQSMQAQLASARLNVPISRASAESKLKSARAAVVDAEAELASARAANVSSEAAVAQMSATYRRAENDRVRYEALVGTHEISRSEYDQKFTDASTAEAQLKAAQANKDAADQRIISSTQKIVQRKSDLLAAETAPQVIESAKANVDRVAGTLKQSRASLLNANLNLGYTSIVAPEDGIVGRKQIEAGQRVSVGELLLTLAPPNDVWVIANFKETQLHHMRIGQAAKIHIDAYDRDAAGTVESIGGATGSRYALIAPDNATGNYVKVVQRVPVRIRTDPSAVGQPPLLPGMSIEVTVHVGG